MHVYIFLFRVAILGS